MAQQTTGRQPRYKRILLKLSGEALMGSEDFGIDPKVLDRMALEVGQLVGIGVQDAVGCDRPHLRDKDAQHRVHPRGQLQQQIEECTLFHVEWSLV